MSRYVGSFVNNKYYSFFFSSIKLFRRINLITAEFPYKDYGQICTLNNLFCKVINCYDLFDGLMNELIVKLNYKTIFYHFVYD